MNEDKNKCNSAEELSLLLSASQITLWTECKRKWGLRYIAKIESPPHPSAVLGTETHDEQLAPYLALGKPFDFTRDSGYIAASIMGWLPEPLTEQERVEDSPRLVSEKHFVMPSPSRQFAYQGYIDLWLPKGGIKNPPDDPPGENTTVSDFKTTGDLKWAKTPLDLEKDIQATIYATWAMFSTGSREVDLDWLYMQTRGPRKAKRVHLTTDPNKVFERFVEIDSIGQEVARAHRTVKDPMTLEPNPSMCDQYGGCPYRSHCNLGPADIITAMAAKETKHHFKDPMNAPSVATPNTSSVLANLKAKRAAAAAGAGATSAPAAAAATGPINPPESALPEAPPVGTPKETAAKRARRTKAEMAAAAASVVAETASTSAEALEPATAPAPKTLAVDSPVVKSELPASAHVNSAFIASCERALTLIAEETDLDKLTRFLGLFFVSVR